MTEMMLQLYSFVALTGLGVWLLQKAETGGEVFFAFLFFPLSIHLALRVFYKIGHLFSGSKHPVQARQHPVLTTHQQVALVPSPSSPLTEATTTSVPLSNSASYQPNQEEVIEELKPDHSRIDMDRRLFLKTIGSAGLGLFLMSIFTKKAQAAFFGSLPGTSAIKIKDTDGNYINPAEEHPTDGYEVTEIDDASAPAYYGFLHTSGAWYITKEASDGSYRYTKGASSFATNWTLRATLSYDYYDQVFS